MRPYREDPAAVVDDQHVARVRVVGEQHPPAGEGLRVGGVADRCAHREAQPSVRADLVDPVAGDLADQDPAIRLRGIAVDRSEVERRVMPAVSRPAELPDDRARPDEQDPAVVGVGDRERAIRQSVRIIGRIQVRSVGADHARVPEQKAKRMIRDPDFDDRLVVLLIGDQSPPPGSTNVSSLNTSLRPAPRSAAEG